MSHAKKLGVSLAVALILTPVMAAHAFPVPTSAAKAQRHKQLQQRVTSFAQRPLMTSPVRAQTPESYRSFSYQPATFAVGDEIVITAEQAKLMRGEDVLATVSKGDRFKVLKVEGNWIGIAVEQEGQTRGGWLWHSHLALAGVRADSYRSFSYQPTDPEQNQQVPAIQSFRGFLFQPSVSRQVRTRNSHRRPNPPYVRQHPGSRRY